MDRIGESDTSETAVERVETLTRAGWLAKGFLFVVIGVLAARLAVGSWSDPEQDPTQTGALRTVADETFGGVIVAILGIGLGIFAVWNLAQALAPGSTERDLLGVAKRIGWLGLAGFYGALSAAAAGITLTSSPAREQGGSGSRTGTGGGTSPKDLTARFLDHPGGRWAVGIAAGITIVVAAYHVHKGLTHDFVADIDTTDLSATSRTWLGRIGAAGFAARGVILGIVGWFLIRAAVTHDSDEAVGLDGALREVAGLSYGRALLFVIATGLIVAGGYDMATFRRQRLR